MNNHSFVDTTNYFDDWVLSGVFSPAVTAEKKRMLIVEDDYTLGEMLGTELDTYGFVTETVISAEEVEVRLEEAIPDVLLSDYYLGKTNGLDLILSLREEKKFKDTIFLIMSGSGEIKNLAKKNNIGFVEKPFSIDQILAEIEAQSSGVEVSYSFENSIAAIKKTGIGKKVKQYLFNE